jgi:hypothetical protein
MITSVTDFALPFSLLSLLSLLYFFLSKSQLKSEILGFEIGDLVQKKNDNDDVTSTTATACNSNTVT